MIDHDIEEYDGEIFFEGDPRRCPRHPNEVTSSPDGMFDAPCGACEFEMEEHFGANEPGIVRVSVDVIVPPYNPAEFENLPVFDPTNDDDCPF
jgi:hypothetical protein